MMRKRVIQSLLLSIFMILIVIGMIQLLDISILNYEARFSAYNDEVFYLKQIQSIFHNGMPNGYFGYNQSTAMIGTFGAWSNIIMYFYAIFCFPFISSYSMLYYANLLIIFCVMFTFFLLNGKGVKQNMLYLVIFGCIVFCRFIFSGMVEVMFYAAVILICLYLLSDTRLNKSIAIVAICVASISRVYFIIFLPLVLLYHKKIDFKSVVLSLVPSLFLGAISMIYTSVFTAAYLSPLVRTSEIISALNQPSLVSSIKGIVRYVFENLNAVRWLIESYFYGFDMIGLIYIMYFLTFFLLIMNAIYEIIKKSNYKESVLILFVYIAVFIAIVNLYQPYQGGRHLFIFIILAWFFLLSRKLKFINASILALIFILTFSGFTKNAYNLYALRDFEIESYTRDLAVVKVDSASSNWDNTLLFEYGVNNNLYKLLSDVAPGIGINLCMTDYLAQNVNNARAKYIMFAANSTNIDAYLDSYSIVSSNDLFAILQKND